MASASKASNFRNPYTVKLGICRNAVIMVVSHLAVFVVFRVKAHVTFAVLERIFGVNPARSCPVANKGCFRGQVNDIEYRS